MIRKQTDRAVLTAGLLLISVMVCGAPAHAETVGALPKHHTTLVVGGAKYYYADGIFYVASGLNFDVVPAPMGATVKTIPSNYQPMTLYGVTYYGDNGTYYVNTGHGYQVVPPPVAYQPPPVSAPAQDQPAAPIQAAPAIPAVSEEATGTSDAYTINIPNGKGGFTPVQIKRSGSGYTGPQGEYYDEFPKIEQLKVMYGK